MRATRAAATSLTAALLAAVCLSLIGSGPARLGR